MRAKLPLAAIVGALILAMPALSSAQTTIVATSSADPTSIRNCTLCDAIDIAISVGQQNGDSCQTTPGGTGYEITFTDSSSGGEIDLHSPLPTITVPVNLTINGPTNPLYISGRGKNQVLCIDNSSATVLLQNLIITGAASTGNGGGIENTGTLTLKDCTFSAMRRRATAVPSTTLSAARCQRWIVASITMSHCWAAEEPSTTRVS